ncbi:MAG: protoheme IX farnesyltransferase [Leptolyngbyaceae cyanobacterium RU_5_1]|nr:protoheme IX farnesyltransferase [Leptolyngbyaceae cyanobacterium RU_5_1]
MQETVLTTDFRPKQTFAQVIQNYVQLTKPRIILLLLITTAGGMWIASQGQVDPKLLLATLTGGALASGAANTINCIYDRDIDSMMDRTRHRPLPSGRVQPRDAAIFAIALATLAFTLLTTVANFLSACLAMSGILVYVLVYTHWLKRHSTQNIVIGGAAGAIPPLVGWAAATGDLSWAAWILFAIIFMWTPPHFWALAIMIQDDYAKVGVPMLPVVVGNAATSRQIFYYTLALIPVTLLLVYPLHVMGAIYCGIALLLGGLFVHKAWKLMQTPSEYQMARSVFKYSILYMMLLCAGMGIDSLPATHQFTTTFADNLQTYLSYLPHQ